MQGPISHKFVTHTNKLCPRGHALPHTLPHTLLSLMSRYRYGLAEVAHSAAILSVQPIYIVGPQTASECPQTGLDPTGPVKVDLPHGIRGEAWLIRACCE